MVGALQVDVLAADFGVARRQLRPHERADQRDRAADCPDGEDQDRIGDDSRDVRRVREDADADDAAGDDDDGIEQTELAAELSQMWVRNVFPLAAGPHPHRPLTLTPRRGFTVRSSVWPPALFPLAAGPDPRRALTLTPRRGFTVRSSVWPQTLLATTATRSGRLEPASPPW